MVYAESLIDARKTPLSQQCPAPRGPRVRSRTSLLTAAYRPGILPLNRLYLIVGRKDAEQSITIRKLRNVGFHRRKLWGCSGVRNDRRDLGRPVGEQLRPSAIAAFPLVKI